MNNHPSADGSQSENDSDEFSNNQGIVVILGRWCAVCGQTIDSSSMGIQPCSCGYYAHPECILMLIRNFEAAQPGCGRLGCRNCKTRYNITVDKSLAVRALDAASNMYGRLCHVGYAGLIVVLADIFLTFHGTFVLTEIYGPNAAKLMLFSMNPFMAMAVCRAIPLISVTVNFIPWEDKLLKLLRRCSELSLPVVGRVFPSIHADVEEDDSKVKAGRLVGGLLLPSFATIVGTALFDTLASPLSRCVLGGLTLVGVRGLIQMYCRQKLYTRQALLAVEPYRED
ncbi:E3 ubiquitin-protein ligase MARCHF5-like [Macrosteles quadrilineatus]|uniref:E3 ubiquitin-protein ligase MARCHF5-like n=1 Tax=Macrosteles quadrilineatus TaxID=74068 RepID=UPI0023E0F358|nr:E3 ubiquitin-protein ligase MARCHF5-like [Macrosteles quadrilineatus]